MAWPIRRFQYSLRALFLLTTVAACGMGWWCRHFEVETVTDEHVFSICGMGGPPPDLYRREVRTVRRTGWNEVLRDGPTYIYNREGNRLEEQNWSFGVKHGMWRTWDESGQLLTEGAFDNGKERGRWCNWERRYPCGGRHETVYDNGEVIEESTYEDPKDELKYQKKFAHGKPIYDLTYCLSVDGDNNDEFRHETRYTYDQQGSHSTMTTSTLDWKQKLGESHGWNDKLHGLSVEWYENGQKRWEGNWKLGHRDGDWTFWDKSGRILYQMQFDNGQLVRLNGEPISNPFTRHPSFIDSEPRSRFSLERLQGGTWKRELRTTLLDGICKTIDDEADRILFNSGAIKAAGVSLGEPVSLDHPGGIPRMAILQTLLSEHHLTCVVRYRQFCITTLKDADDWKDPTGIYRLQPERGSKWWLFFEWSTSDVFDEPLSDIITKYFDNQRRMDYPVARVQLDRAAFAEASRNPDKEQIRYVPQSIRDQDALGAFLYLSDCCCALEDDILVIRPQPSKMMPPSP